MLRSYVPYTLLSVRGAQLRGEIPASGVSQHPNHTKLADQAELTCS